MYTQRILDELFTLTCGEAAPNFFSYPPFVRVSATSSCDFAYDPVASHETNRLASSLSGGSLVWGHTVSCLSI